MADRLLDLSATEMGCGDPALQVVRRELERLEVGQVLAVQTTVAEHAFAVRAWARKKGIPVVADRTDGAQTHIEVQRV
ncbi:MAG: hypothetical protein ACRDZO_17155 [Egibacteraceae bacterium]